ncbi:MAG: hypothetical protein HC767_01195 [Akkermansiaceae bacterium]|nr:hypothetical protein [Akkermansiaceae bacterium]
MVTSHYYTEKVDVFALSVMLYEVLRCRLNVTRIALAGEPGALQQYADEVAQGKRPGSSLLLLVTAWPGACRPARSRFVDVGAGVRSHVFTCKYGWEPRPHIRLLQASVRRSRRTGRERWSGLLRMDGIRCVHIPTCSCMILLLMQHMPLSHGR